MKFENYDEVSASVLLDDNDQPFNDLKTASNYVFNEGEIVLVAVKNRFVLCEVCGCSAYSPNERSYFLSEIKPT